MSLRTKNISFALMLIWLLIFSVSQGLAKDQTAESGESGASPVKVAYCIDCVPFQFQDEQGIPSGLIIDLWNLWSEKTGQGIEFIPYTWNISLKKVGSGEADAHAGLFFNKQRDKFLDYGLSLSESSTHVFLHKALPTISNLSDLAVYRVGVLSGDYVEGFLKEKLPAGTIVAYPSYEEIISALRSGELRAFAADTPTGIYHLQKANLLGEYSVKSPQLLYTNDWFVAVTEGNQSLLERINMGFDLLTGEERLQITRRWTSPGDEKALIIAIDRDYPPLTQMTSFGEPVGFLVDLWRAWAVKTGHEVRFRMSDWAGTVKAMRQGEADIHSGLFLNKERQEFLDFSQPIYQINSSFYYRRDDILPEDPAQFGNRRVAATAGSYQESTLRQNYPDLKLISFPSGQTALEALKSGKVDAVIGEDLTMEVLLDDLGWDSKITNIPTPLFSNVVYGAVAKRNEQLLAKVNGGLNSLTLEEKAAMEQLWLKHPQQRAFDSIVAIDSDRLQLTIEERAWLEAHPDLQLGVDPSWSPYDFVDSHGKHQGLAADVLGSLRRTLGIRTNLSPDLTWSQVLKGAQKRTVDIVSLLAPTPERAEYLLFSDPILTTPWVIATRTDYKLGKGVKSLYGKKVVVAQGCAVISLLRKHSDLAFTEVATPLEALKKVSLGEADAYIGYLGSIVHMIREEGLFNLHVANPTGFPSTELSIGVRSDWSELLALVNKGLEAIPKEKMRAMVDRWTPLDSSVTATSKVTLSEQEQAWLEQHPEITIAFEGNFAPYSEYVSGGGFSGYAVDVVNLISQRTGIQFKIHPDGEWQTLYASSQKKEVDVVAEMVPREERKEWFAFTDPYIFLSSYIFTKSNDTRVHSRSDVDGMRVALIEDYSHTDYVLAAHPDVTPVYVKNALEALNSVREGHADLFIGASGIANHLINKHGMTDLHTVALWQQNVSNKGFGVRKDWPELVTILSKGLASISKQEWEALHAKWISLGAISEGADKEVAELSLPEQVTFDQTGFFLQSIAIIFIAILVIVLAVWVAQGRPKQLTIRETLFLVSFVFAGLIVSIGTLVTLLLNSQQEQSEIESRKYESLNLALELRQSSDDLTRFSRAFTVSGEPAYEDYFKSVIAIRDGKQPHPKGVTRSYWDYVTAGVIDQDQSGDTYGIEQRMEELEFSAEEKDKISEAIRESDDLIRLEEIALNYVKGWSKDKDGAFTIEGEPDLDMARKILYGQTYHLAKSKIMKLIDEFFTLLEWRTANEFNLVRAKNNAILLAISALTLITIVFSVYVFFLLRRRIVAPLSQLQIGAQAIEGENYTHNIDILFQDEVGALAKAFNSMARSIDERTSRLQQEVIDRKKSQDLTKRYEFIVNSVNDMMTYISNDYIYRAVNDIWCETTGIKRQDIIGKSVAEAWGQEAFEKEIQPGLDKCFAGEEVSFKKWLKIGSGERRHFDVNFFPYFDDKGSTTNVVAVSYDITEQTRAEEGLRKLNRAVEDNPLAIIITDREGTIEYVNPKFTYMTGYEPDEAIGESPRILSSGHHPPEFFKELWETILAGKEWQGEFRNKRKTGELYWQSAIIAPIMGEKHEITHFVSIQEDVTEKKKAAEEVQKLSRAIEQSPVSVVITNPEGTIEYVNPCFFEVTGYSLEEAIGQNPRMLSSGKQPPEFYKDMWETLTSGHTWTGELANKKKNGEIFWESASISPVRDLQGKITHYVAVKEDITQSKLMKEELIKAKQKAEEATKAKSDFLANMSHEIRTPMNAIIGMSHLALKTELTPKQQDYIGKVQSSSNALLGIINDILDFSKIEAGKLDMESTNFQLEDVLSNLANLIGIKAEEKGLELLFNVDKDAPTGLIGDPLRLGQILINLANNAVKFTEKGEIVVSVSSVETSESNATLQFSVQDSGIGLTEEQRGKLFQAFSQADTSTTRKYGGTGLGLTISKKLCELMGGEIWVESVPGQGSTFIFTAVFGCHEEKKVEFLPDPDLRGKRVLVVDDHQMSRDVLRDMLESMTFRISQTVTGEEALAEVSRADRDDQPYEVVYMDWRMPGLDGIATSRMIKEMELSLQPKIIMVTGYGREEIMQQAEEIKLEGFLVKPVTRSLLLDTTMQAFGREGVVTHDTWIDKDKEVEALKDIRGARILLAEDNEINQQVAREILEQAALVVEIANDGKEAVEMARKNMYDAILMDIQMPVMSGFEATKEIRNLETEVKDIPIIAMTAHAMAGDREKSLEGGMNDHVVKPINPDELFGALVRWVKKDRVQGSGVMDQEGKKEERTETKKEKQIDFPESIPGVDLKDGLQRMMGNKTLFLKILRDYVKGNENFTEQVREALNNNELETAERLAHTLKGVSGNIGATGVQEKALALETGIKEQSDTLQGLLEDTWSALQVVLNGIGEALPAELDENVGSSSDEVYDMNTIAPKMIELRKLLEISDMEAESVFQEIKAALSALYPEQAAQLAKALDALDFKQALKATESIENA